MDKRLRLSISGAIRVFTVFAVAFWMWHFFRSYILFLFILIMITVVILSSVSLRLARNKIQPKTELPYHLVGKNTDFLASIRFLNPLRFVGFAIDVTYLRENLFTQSAEEKKDKLWAAPRKGGSLRHFLNSRYAGLVRESVEAFRVYDPLRLFYLEYRGPKAAEVVAWPVFSDGEDAEEHSGSIEGFPEEDVSRKQGTEHEPEYEIREYIAGDALKSIHWKLSAKQGKTMVRERAGAGRDRINVLLPLSEDADENDALMESLYGMGRFLLAEGYPLRLFWQGVAGDICSRCIAEAGEFENVLGEILSANGIRVFDSAQEQMALEYPLERYILVRTGKYKGTYVPSRQEGGWQRGGHSRLIPPKRREKHTADVALTEIRDREPYDFLAVLTRTLILFFLVYGSVGGFLAAFGIPFHASLCMLVLFVLAFALSAACETGKKWLINLTSLLVFLLFLVIAFTNYWVINNGYYYILNHIFDAAREYFGVSDGLEYSLRIENEYLAVTTFAVFLGMVGVILLNIQMQNKCTLLKVMLLTLTPYVIPMYLECSPSLLYIFFMLIGYATVMVLANDRGRISRQTRYLLPVTAAVVMLFAGMAAFIMPEAGYTRVVPRSAAKEATVKGMEQFARYGMPALFSRDIAGSGVSGGKLSKGSAVMPSYETALTVRYTPYSFEPVYLKAFTGLDYIGTSWTQAQAQWPDDADMEGALYSRQRQFEETGGAAYQGEGIMEVERSGAGDDFEFRPYYTDYCNIEEKDGVFSYRYYPDNKKAVPAFAKAPYERYLVVPESCEAAVRRVCEEAGFGGTTEEIAGQIEAYFAENYHYTLRPGFYYGDPDYISHFLLESKKGYCAHFASAAVMLFRQMGIPARYAEGYAFSYAALVENGELVEGADYNDYYKGFSEIGETALIQMEIPEAYAHAWVEIYDDERGWIVTDPTPASDDEETASFWDVFMNGGSGETERVLTEDVFGGYMEDALGTLPYVLFAVVVIAAALFAAVRLIAKEKEKRLPDRERVRREYGRLQMAAAKKKGCFDKQRTLQEQIAWMRENCHAKISGEQEKALYQVFFAEDIDYDCDKLCEELRKCLRT